jgi:Zn-dependent protease
MNTLAVLEGLQPHFLAAFTDGWPDKLILFFGLVASLSVHEWAHAITADKLGDPLPRAEGRVTLNPLAHVDPIGTFLIPLTVLFFSPGFSVFGWGKPVRVSLPNEKTRVRDDLLITAAGPFSNLCIALLTACIAGLFIDLDDGNAQIGKLAETIITLNCLLFVFNLIPVPPLDGSHFLKYAVRMKDETYAKLSSYGFLILLVLINLPAFRQTFGTAIFFCSSFFIDLQASIRELVA